MASSRLQILLIPPILLSLGLFLYWFSLVLTGQVCPSNPLFLFPFVAYLGLFAFPLVVLLVRVLVTKQFHLDFGNNQKEVTVSFWVWTVLMLVLAGFFWFSRIIVLPGAEHLLCLR